MSQLLKAQYRLTLQLDEAERLTLEEALHHHPRPDVRERCSALLQIADGASPHAVARHGLLVARDPDSVYSWLHHFQHEGIAGLLAHRQGGNQRGRL